MRVLERGRAPLKRFVRHPLVGSVQRVGIRWERIGSAREASAPATPGVQLVLTLEVLQASPVGEVDYRFSLGQVDLLGAGGLEAPRKALEALSGLRGEGRGGTGSGVGALTLALPAELSPSLREPLQQMASLLRGLGGVLPPEPLGPGARWEQADFGGPLLPEGLVVSELMAVDEDRLEVRHEVRDPGRGHGGCLLVLDRLWPTRFELEVPHGGGGFRVRLRELSLTPPPGARSS